MPDLTPAKVREIVFGTRVAGSISIETPETIVRTTAERIWKNLDAYVTTGDWPDRRRTAEEVDREESLAAPARSAPLVPRGRTTKRARLAAGAPDLTTGDGGESNAG